MAGMTRVRMLRKRRSPRLLIVQAASGAGKSSFLRAGLWPRLRRDPDFAPLAIVRPALGIISGPDGLGRRMAPFFAHYGQTRVPGDINARLMQPGAEAAIALASLLHEATTLATHVRRAGAADARAPAPILAIDQGEELFAPENAAESLRFLDLLAAVLKEPPGEVDPYVLLTIRVDSVDPLLQRWPALGLDTPETQVLPPLAPSAYRDVIVKPAQVYTSRVRRLEVEPALVDQLARDATGADALPLLAFTLEKLFDEFGADGNLTLARYEAAGGVGGSIDRALAQARREAGERGRPEDLERLMVPGLATWDMAANAAKRLPADEAALLAGDRAHLAPLARALVEGRLLMRGANAGASTLEVAHEALLRRPPIDGWLDARKDALKLRDDVLKEAKDWSEGGRHAEGLVRRGARLEAALALQADPDFASALAPAKDYLGASRSLETAGRRRARRIQYAIYASLLAFLAASQYAIFQEPIHAFVHWNTKVRWYIAENVAPHLLSEERERALKPGDTFQECKAECPEMVVIPGGTFVMGSPDGQTPIIGLDGKPKDGPLAPAEQGRQPDEGPQHEVAIATFAAGRHEVTWDDWEACVRMKGCPEDVSDAGWGKVRQPVINVSWDYAQKYVTWLSRVTRKPYRLLSEAEWEYAARAGSTTRFSFGDDERKLCMHANFADKALKKAAPTFTTSDICSDGEAVAAEVGKYQANTFKLHDMHGNVNEWTEDCYVKTYEGAPIDGSARQSTDCKIRVARGGSWNNVPVVLRAAFRFRNSPGLRDPSLGFRVGRSLLPPRTL